MLIRRPDTKDIVPLAEVHVASWRAAYRGVFRESVLSLLPESDFRRVWENDAAAHEREHLVAEHEGRPVGFVSFGATRDADGDPEKTGEIDGLYCVPEVWDRGYGRELCDRALSDLAGMGYEDVTLWVLADNGRARRFYEKAGFEDDQSERTIEGPGVKLREVRYRKRVKPSSS